MTRKERRIRQWTILIGVIAAAFVVFLLNIGIGTVFIEPGEVLDIIFGTGEVNPLHESIVLNIRLPRAIATALGGGCLAVSGVLLQVFFQNPIVEPYVLGISSGSSMFVAIVVMGGYTFGFRRLSPLMMFTGAFLGAMAVMMAVIFAARRVRTVATLLIIGIMAGYICNAGIKFLSTFAEQERIAQYQMWTNGTFAGFTWEQVRVVSLIAIPFLCLSVLMGKQLNTMLLGEKYAQSMGVGVKMFRIVIVIISSVLTAAISAFTGPISFVGLAVPHIVRICMGTSDNRMIVPTVIFAGSVMTGICDLGARMLMQPAELPLSVLTSVIGAPLVIYLLLSRKRGEIV